ncbi:uncharacterized protein LOC106662500 isoform X1 [Cimex lectularius]|uniref:Transcription factor IIIC 90kDa subunit N-terminal domain-containing protein n=1 Tax=Cimex lectularius TaxID=79782 RepID=A0A8I6RHF2_CIMLE|nr:uncharacterized protein LOC106662500 isoform X1 [Cimex lectularius]
MKIQDFQVTKCSSHIHVPFSSAWSEDGFVATATEMAVYITEFKPNPMNRSPALDMTRSVILPKQDNPTMNSDIDILKLAKVLGENELYTLVQDITLSPHIKAEAFKPTVKYISWSPVPDPSEFRSLLTVLTDSGALDFYIKFRDDWVNIKSISTDWVAFCKETWNNISVFKTSQEAMSTLKERTYKIKITAFCWGGIYCKTKMLFFFSTKDGTLVVWEVGMTNSRQISTQFLKSYQTNAVDISSLTCVRVNESKYFVYYASIDGRIQGIDVELSQKVLSSDLETLNNITDEDVTFGCNFFIWNDEDKIQINAGGMLTTKDNDTNFLIVAKGSHLLIFTLDSDGSSSTVDITTTEDVAITGLSILSNNELLITTRGATITLLTFYYENDSFTKSCDFIECPLKNDLYACFGIALSKNKVIGYLPFSVKAAFDHLQIREVANTFWCALPELTEIKFLIETKSKQPTREMWDILEVARVLHQKKLELLQVNEAISYDTMDIEELQKKLWCVYAILNDSSFTSKTDIAEHKDLLVLLIQIRSASNWTMKLLESYCFGEFEVSSLNRIREWLSSENLPLDEQFVHTKASLNYLQKMIEDSNIPQIKEACQICGSSIINSEKLSAICSKGHSVPRCSISFVQCADIKHYVCKICNLIAHKNTVEREQHCSVCDGYFKINELLLDDEEMDDS